jgi:very-short-patch-repair endonuclease
MRRQFGSLITANNQSLNMSYYCYVCKETINQKEYDYSTNTNGIALCSNHQKTVTHQALKLSKALNSLRIEHKLEQGDGFKHVDIAIEFAKLYVELDGSQHVLSPKQMLADHERDKHSLRAGYITKRIPNNAIDKDVDSVATGIAMLAHKRYKEITEEKKKRSITKVVKNVINTARSISEKLENFE